MTDRPLTTRIAAEFLGTAFLVFVGAGSIPALAIARGDAPFVGADLGFIGLAFAAVILVTVLVFGAVSGNHINPVVTLGLAVSGRFPWPRVPGYVIAQLAGGLAGAGLIALVLGDGIAEVGAGVAAATPSTSWLQIFVGEFVGTFLLVFVVLSVIARDAAPGWAGLGIGFAVFGAILVIGPVTGASLNPARNIGPMVVQQLAGGAVEWSQLTPYVLAEVMAAAVAALAAWMLERPRPARA